MGKKLVLALSLRDAESGDVWLSPRDAGDVWVQAGEMKDCHPQPCVSDQRLNSHSHNIKLDHV